MLIPPIIVGRLIVGVIRGVEEIAKAASEPKPQKPETRKTAPAPKPPPPRRLTEAERMVENHADDVAEFCARYGCEPYRGEPYRGEP